MNRLVIPGRISLPMLFAAWAASGACAPELAPSRADLELRLPVPVGFDSVADALQPSCGTLDCHGQQTRGLRLFGGRGLRLDGTGSAADGTTTAGEYEANYWAIVALEPEVLSDVLRDGGRNPERLIFIRKGRGTSSHKGGALMRPNGDLDRCVTEWLKGNILLAACDAAARLTAPTSP